MYRKLCRLTFMLIVFGFAGMAIGQPTGQILFEYWFDIGGTAVSDLTSHPDYPDNPHDGELRDRYEGPVDWLDNYGSRARGYLYPPEDGDYTFWISGDDFEELYLSTDDSPANATLIAEVPGWTSHLEWDKYPEQQSAPITLAAGQMYYIESIMKEGGGGDSMTVAWAGPGIGDELTIIDGAYLSPADWSPSLLKARNPIPADGAVDVDTGTLEWTPGATTVSHVVYFSEDATIDAADLLMESPLNIVAVDTAPGITYYWRVDEVDADGVVYEGNVWSFTTTPLEAHFPVPEDGAVNVITPVTLTWTPGKVVVMHDLYLGTNEAAVAARDMSTFKGKLMQASYDTGPLELFTTYYWAVDQFTPTGTVAGPVWRFSTPNEIIITEGATTLNYDNTAEPYVSEAAFDVPMDITAGGLVSDLTLSIQGQPGNLSIDESTGTYEVAGSGADVWGSSDQFHYVYQELTGDGTITARVVSNGTGSNTWAKGGVMIRETTAPDSRHMIMALTGSSGSGIAFQGRFEATGANSSSLHGDITAAPPHWVRITREGNTITGYHSADGVTWEMFTDSSPDNSGGPISNPIDVEMADPVLIGLFVTSHAAGEVRTYTFDNVSVEGDVGELVSEDIASVSGNSAEQVYVTLEDTSGASATVVHPNPAATQIPLARQWTIPLSKFTNVDPTSASKLYVGVGDGSLGSVGILNVFDIRVVESSPDIIWVSGAFDDNGDGAPDDQEWVSILTKQGYNVDYALDQRWRDLDDEKIAKLNAARLIIVSRNSNSGDYDDGDEVTQWNAITTPIIMSSTHIVRSSRWRWVDSTAILSLTPSTMVLADGTEVSGINEAVGPTSFIDTDPGNGTVLATGDGLPWIIEWEAGVEFYEGSGQIAGGPRMFFAAGTQEGNGVGRGEMNLQAGALEVFLDLARKHVVSDVTMPGDIVVGVPDDGDWPGNEHPALAIDDNVNTKYLHFKGDFEPDPGTGGTGLRITPLDGPSLVTGLSLTTANDVPGRDPIAFELSGSNESIDGPYELIAAGDIVDFMGEEPWPRFTVNTTPIVFENTVKYSHYQLIFPAIRGPVGGSVNSMQIAEVVLLGGVCWGPPDKPICRHGEPCDWQHDNGSDEWDESEIGAGNPGGKSVLNDPEKGSFWRIQDTGDPRPYGYPDPGSNRKIYLTCDIPGNLDGAELIVPIRVATDPPLDDHHPADGIGPIPWPVGGIGYHIRDNGKGMFGIGQHDKVNDEGVVVEPGGIISFSLAREGEENVGGLAPDALVMNNRQGSTGDVDSQDWPLIWGGNGGTINYLPIPDYTQWNTFYFRFKKLIGNTYEVSVWLNDVHDVTGPEKFTVTLGTGLESNAGRIDPDPSSPYKGLYVALGSSGTPAQTAFDVGGLGPDDGPPPPPPDPDCDFCFCVTGGP